MSSLMVIKFNKEKEPFSLKKVYNSAIRAGASSFLARTISLEIEKEAYQDITTAEIFKKVKDKLKKENLQSALRFNLKEAMRKLGPAGFIFEDFVRQVLSRYFVHVEGSTIIHGICSKYEVDFLVEKENIIYIGECKYRNNSGDKVDVNVCLKSFAILDDVKNNARFKGGRVNSLIVTNSKFTDEAIRYSSCKKMELLGWRYPKDQGLESMVEERKLYPVTILPSFKGYLAEELRREKIMLVEDILSLNIDKLVKRVNMPRKQMESLMREAEILLNKK
jgi:hypothetical protein